MTSNKIHNRTLIACLLILALSGCSRVSRLIGIGVAKAHHSAPNDPTISTIYWILVACGIVCIAIWLYCLFQDETDQAIQAVQYFYFDHDNQKQGPFSEEQILKLAKEGVIRRDTEIESSTGRKGAAEQITNIPFKTTGENLFTEADDDLRYFYLDKNNKKQGPISEKYLRKLTATGIICRDTPLETDTGYKGTAEQIPNMLFKSIGKNPFTLPPSRK